MCGRRARSARSRAGCPSRAASLPGRPRSAGRDGRVAVHPALDVQRRVGVAAEDEEPHAPATGPRLKGVCLNGRVQAQVEELPENRVRLTVQVPSHDVHHAVEHAASDLAQTAKIPGFRKGKVPRQVLVQKVGRERLMAEAIESHIGGWFWNAAARTRVRPVAQPEYDFELPVVGRRGLGVHRDRRRAGEARAAGLDDARGRRDRGRGARGARPAGARRGARDRRRARPGRRAARRRPRTR